MPYITSNQIYGKIPAPKVNDACDDAGTGDPAGIAATLAQVLQNASDAVDADLQGRYAVPFATPPLPVQQAALVFACQELWGRRPIADTTNPFAAEAKRWHAKLEKITARELGLAADVASEVITPGAAITEKNPLNCSMS